MKCRQCHADIDIYNWQYCPHCGGSLKDEKALFAISRFFRSKRNIAIFIAAELAVVGIFFGLFWRSRLEVGRKNQEIAEMNQKQQEITVEPRLKDRILTIAYSGEKRTVGDLLIESPVYGRLKIETEIPGISLKKTDIINIKPENKIYKLDPEISSEGYADLSGSKNATLDLKVSYVNDDGSEKELYKGSSDIFFYARNDIIWHDENGYNSRFIVRLINKDREEVKDLVRKAADHMVSLGNGSNSMVGMYGDEKEIKRQLEAIFLAMKKDDEIRYVMAPFSYDDASAQNIKAPEEVVKTKSGLCVELSMLMSAALENVGLNPVIVMLPGHAWAGVEVSPESQKYIFIETTALDKSPEEAVDIAMKNWDKIKDMPHTYQLLNVNELRAEGLDPIRY